MRVLLLFAIAGLLVASACGSVPEVVFVDDDAGRTKDGGPSSSEAGAETGSSEAGTSDGGYACPDSLPPPAGVVCCGNSNNNKVFCLGDCPDRGSDGQECRSDCADKGCGTTNICCRSSGGNVRCVPFGQTCT